MTDHAIPAFLPSNHTAKAGGGIVTSEPRIGQLSMDHIFLSSIHNQMR